MSDTTTPTVADRVADLPLVRAYLRSRDTYLASASALATAQRELADTRQQYTAGLLSPTADVGELAALRTRRDALADRVAVLDEDISRALRDDAVRSRHNALQAALVHLKAGFDSPEAVELKGGLLKLPAGF